MVNCKTAASLIRVLIAFAALLLITAGAVKGGYKDVNNKANRVCYECIGIG